MWSADRADGRQCALRVGGSPAGSDWALPAQFVKQLRLSAHLRMIFAGVSHDHRQGITELMSVVNSRCTGAAQMLTPFDTR
jgi:hypothetical protein